MVVQRLFGLAAVAIGGLFVYNAARTYRASERRSEYEPVEARVLASEIETDVSPGDNPSENMARYIPDVEYEYTVDGETHVNDNLYPGPVTSGSHTEDETRAIVDRYPEGDTVEAFYDPEDPADAFLESESQKRQAISLGVLGVAGLVFGLVTLVATPF